ncbi:MAG: hypothetical protein ABEK84_01970 [Salinibacter sp.]
MRVPLSFLLLLVGMGLLGCGTGDQSEADRMAEKAWRRTTAFLARHLYP